jgi:redox-sensitive bicupin YhaK (pirin superfamily)
VRDHGPFRLRRIHPGVALGRTDDGGFGRLGLIDHARLQPGLVVKYDTHLSAGASIDLPAMPGFDRWLYVFRGAVLVGNEQAETHTALAISADTTALEVTAIREADLVLFLVDRQAPFSRAGTLSG